MFGLIASNSSKNRERLHSPPFSSARGRLKSISVEARSQTTVKSSSSRIRYSREVQRRGIFKRSFNVFFVVESRRDGMGGGFGNQFSPSPGMATKSNPPQKGC